MKHQLEGLAAIAAAGIRLLDGQLRAVQHAQSEDRFRIVFDGPEEADADLGEVFGIGEIAGRTGVDVGMGVVDVVRRGKLGVGAEVGRLSSVGCNGPILRRCGRVGATFAYMPAGSLLQNLALPCRR